MQHNALRARLALEAGDNFAEAIESFADCLTSFLFCTSPSAHDDIHHQTKPDPTRPEGIRMTSIPNHWQEIKRERTRKRETYQKRYDSPSSPNLSAAAVPFPPCHHHHRFLRQHQPRCYLLLLPTAVKQPLGKTGTSGRWSCRSGRVIARPYIDGRNRAFAWFGKRW